MNRMIMFALLALASQTIQAEEPSTAHRTPECNCLETNSPITMEESLHSLGEKLNLTEQQRPLWDTWSQQLLRAHHSKDEFNQTAKERRKLPAPERQEKWMASAETHLHAMRDSLPALRSLYSSLNEQQRATFDNEVPFKHHSSGMNDCRSRHSQ